MVGGKKEQLTQGFTVISECGTCSLSVLGMQAVIPTTLGPGRSLIASSVPILNFQVKCQGMNLDVER